MKFNISRYKNRNYAMQCHSEQEADIFCKYLDSVGRRWITGLEYSNFSMWCDASETGIIYYFNQGLYGYMIPKKSDKFIILQFSDFEWDER